MPDYIKNIDQLNAKGYEVFVTNAWSESLNASGKVKILADPNAQFTKVCIKYFVCSFKFNNFLNFFK